MPARTLTFLVRTVFTAIVVVLAIFTQSLATEANSIHWEESYEKSLKKAIEENKPVVIYLYLDGCDSCNTMEANVFSDAAVIQFSRSQVYVKLNVEEGSRNGKLAEKFGITHYPTILVVNGHEIEIDRLEGAGTPEDYISLMCCVLADVSFGSAPQECKESKARDVRKYFVYGKKKYDSYEFEQAAKVFQRIAKIDPKNKYGTTDRALHLLGVSHIYLGQAEKGGSFLAHLINDFPKSIAIPDATYILGQVYMQQGRKDEAVSLLRTLIEKHPKHIFVPEAREALEQLADKPSN